LIIKSWKQYIIDEKSSHRIVEKKGNLIGRNTGLISFYGIKKKHQSMQYDLENYFFGRPSGSFDFFGHDIKDSFSDGFLEMLSLNGGFSGVNSKENIE
jgi:hypothetical protein